jgi:hypothetical protein
VTLICVLVTVPPANAAPRAASVTNFYVAGANLAINQRTGYFSFDTRSARQDTSRANAISAGFSAGKRYQLLAWMRLQVTATFDFGRLAMDTFSINQPQPYSVAEKYSLFHAGLEPLFQFVLPRQGTMTPYFMAGGGLNYLFFSQRFFRQDDQTQEIEFIGVTPVKQSRWCPSALAGLGADISFTKDLGVSIGYLFRYWRPIDFQYRTDLIEPIDYTETFLSHRFLVQLLFTFE